MSSSTDTNKDMILTEPSDDKTTEDPLNRLTQSVSHTSLHDVIATEAVHHQTNTNTTTTTITTKHTQSPISNHSSLISAAGMPNLTTTSHTRHDSNTYYHEYTNKYTTNGKPISNPYTNLNSIRIVSQKECNAMKRNFILLLKENNADEKEELNCQDFINMFKKILPNSPDQEVKKLFNILHGDDENETPITIEQHTNNNQNLPQSPDGYHIGLNMKAMDTFKSISVKDKTISFNGMLNNPSNFQKLLHSMGCITETEQQQQLHDGDHDNVTRIDGDGDGDDHGDRTPVHYDTDSTTQTDTAQPSAEPEDTDYGADICIEAQPMECMDDDGGAMGIIDHIDHITNLGINGGGNNHNLIAQEGLYFSAIPSNNTVNTMNTIGTVCTIHDSPVSNTDDTVFQAEDLIPQLPSTRHTSIDPNQKLNGFGLSLNNNNNNNNFDYNPKISMMPAVHENNESMPHIPFKQQIYVRQSTLEQHMFGDHQRRESASAKTLGALLSTKNGVGHHSNLTLHGNGVGGVGIGHNPGKSSRFVNGINYNEYIIYQKEQINELKNRINELNNFELKCQELSLVLEIKEQEIENQNEEIRQLNEDKQEYMKEVEKIKNEYDGLLQEITELNQIKKLSEIQHKQQTSLNQHLETLQNHIEISEESSSKLKQEKQKLNTLNSQFSQINQHLRNELEKEKNKIIKLKETITKKDEEIKNITLDILGKEQVINSLQNANEDLTNQLNMYLYSSGNPVPASTRYGGHGNHSKHSSIDWKYGPTIYTQSPRNSQCLEFDMFEDLTPSHRGMGSPRASVFSGHAMPVTVPQHSASQTTHRLNSYNQSSHNASSSTSIPMPIPSNYNINQQQTQWYTYREYAESHTTMTRDNKVSSNESPAGGICIKLNDRDISTTTTSKSPKKKPIEAIEEEKILEFENMQKDHLMLINRIAELELELEGYKNMEDVLKSDFQAKYWKMKNGDCDGDDKKGKKRRVETKSIGTQTDSNPGFWERLLGQIQCVPNPNE